MEFKSVVCNLGKELYGIDINLVQGIEKEQDIVRVPNTASYIKGIMNLRGDIIPIYSLRKKFGMEDDPSISTQFIIVRIGQMPLAIEVDGVGEIYEADQSKVHKTPSIVLSGETQYVDKVVNADGKLILIINIEKLLTDSEKAGIEELIDSCK
jgi:purine-binding chemotaxis protein CheW